MTASNGQFELNQCPFYFAGTNNYYVIYTDQYMTDDVINSTKVMRFKVLRTWGFIDIGSLDGSVQSIDSQKV